MNHETFPPSPELASFIKCHWILEVPAQDDVQKQLILPDGCLDMVFILGDDIRRYTSETEFILQPREMILGQITQPFYVQPTGIVNSFAVRFYPYGFANFVSVPLKNLVNTETPLAQLFGEEAARELRQQIISAAGTPERIEVVEKFFISRLHDSKTVDTIVKTTIDTILATKGSTAIADILKEDVSKRRQLERNFREQIGISPKHLGKIIRLQAALKMLLNRQSESLGDIAYESEYYDQAHFIKDFKAFAGLTPKEFLGDENMILSSLLYK